jgi:glycerol-3-phosphate dehydrogenase
VLQTFSGVRPLYDDGAGNPSAVTRDYVFDLDTNGGAPLLNVFGGKITTFRKLAEHALQRLRPTFPEMGKDWTSTATLPGGRDRERRRAEFIARLEREFAWLPRDLMLHYARTYGARTPKLIGSANSASPISADSSAAAFLRGRGALPQ